MKRACFSPAIIVIAVAMAMAVITPTHAVLTSYLKFDGDFSDSSGNGHTGVAVGNVAFDAAVPTQIGSGQSIILDGAGDFVRLTNGHTIAFGGESASTTQDFSVSAWVDAGNVTNRVIVSKARGTVSGDHAAAFFVDGSGQARFDNFFVAELHGGINLQNAGFHHVATTFNDATNRYTLFVDGVVKATKIFNPALPADNLTDSNWELQIGDTKNTTFPSPGDFLGRIDDVSTYSHRLRAADVADLATGRATPLTVGQATSPQSYSNLVLADNPLVYYRFEEAVGATVAVDSSGNGNHGTYVGGVTLGTANDLVGLGNAGRFNGTNGRVDVASLGSFAQSTVEAWINVDALASGCCKSIYSTDAFGTGNLHFNVKSGLDIEHAIGNGGPDNINTPGGVIALDDWFHVVASYDRLDGGRTKIWINGILLAEGFHGSSPFANFSDANVGSFNLSRFFNGRIDEFAIYDSILNEQQILAHMAARNGSASVPEPASLALLALAAVGTMSRRRRMA